MVPDVTIAVVRVGAIEVPLPPWPAPPKRLLRISAALYNRREEYEQLASALGELGLAAR